MARTSAELTPGEILTVEELAALANHTVFYKDGSGTIIWLALGASGTVLQSNGATSAPTFATPAWGDIAATIHAAASKATPVDTDEIWLVDSAASYALKKLTWANLKATLKTYFDGLYPSGSGTSSGTNTGDQNLFSTIAVSGQSNVVADTTSDTLTLAAGSGIAITTDASTDTVTIAATASGWWFWTSVPGSPVRASNTTFTVTGDYTAIFAKGVYLKWTESSTVRNAMVSIPSTYSAPNTTVTIVGDTMASIDSSSLKYAIIGVEPFVAKFAVAGAIGATGTDIANAYYATEPMRVLAADLQVGTAGTTNSTTIDINKGGTTMFTTKPTLATTVASSPTPFTADTATSLALGDRVTIDGDAVQTTPAVDLYVQLYLFPTRYNNIP